MSTAKFVVGYLNGVVILLLWVWIGVALHMAYTKMDLILSHLKNCRAVKARASLKNGGPWGKLLLIGGISSFVAFPGVHLSKGELSQDDLENLPHPLKRKLVALQWSVWVLLAAMSVLVLVGTSGLLG